MPKPCAAVPDHEHDPERDLAACQELLVDGSRSFLAASRILPREVARAACALYAFCRLADDSVDGVCGGHGAGGDLRGEARGNAMAGATGDARGEAPGNATVGARGDAGGRRAGEAGAAAGSDASAGRAGRSAAALAQLHERLDRIYAGTPRACAADRAFAAVVARYRMPRAWPQALLEGFAWDAQGRQYEDLAQVRDYAARVAGSVGAMMARVMGVQARAAVARACELGVAMQLTNIARDVGEDARLGRLYLPRAWMREAGLDPDAWLARPAYSSALGGVIDRLLEEARRCYEGGVSGIGHLPAGCRPGISAAALLYADIGRSVRVRGCDSVSARAVVRPARKAQLMAWAALASLAPRARAYAPPPGEIEFLLDAAGLPDTAHEAAPASLHSVLALFERLERRDRGLHAGFDPVAAQRMQA
jgi:phytoene synthase